MLLQFKITVFYLKMYLIDDNFQQPVSHGPSKIIQI